MFNAIEETAPTVTFVITIGRNVPVKTTRRYPSWVEVKVTQEPMSPAHWASFQEEALALILDASPTLYSKGETVGHYKGVTEQGFAFIGTMSGHAARLLRPKLSALAAQFGQEAIGFIEQADTNTLLYASV